MANNSQIRMRFYPKEEAEYSVKNRDTDIHIYIHLDQFPIYFYVD